jgi:hypothetical protein
MIVWLLVLWGCGNEASTCQSICDELVTTCSYEAYPSYDSCLQGCEYDAEQGADVEAKQECVAGAECNTFVIVECEHQSAP